MRGVVLKGRYIRPSPRLFSHVTKMDANIIRLFFSDIPFAPVGPHSTCVWCGGEVEPAAAVRTRDGYYHIACYHDSITL